MTNQGWIKLFYRFKDWEWYQDTNVKVVFLHLLLKANFTPTRWKGHLIPRGSMATSYSTLAEQLKLKPDQIRVAIKKLKITGEITIKTTNKYSVITICNFEKWQSDEGSESQAETQSSPEQIPDKPQANPIQIPFKSQQYKNIRNKYIVVVDNARAREITAEEFLKEFFSENRRATIEQIVMSRGFGSIENFIRLARLVVAEWEVTEEKPKGDLNEAYKHLLNHCSRKHNAERAEQKAGARTISRAANQANDKAPRNVNEQWAGIEMPTH